MMGEKPDANKLAPSIIPFGEDIVMTATGFSSGKAFVVVRAVADAFVGTPDPVAAWQANEFNGGPAWFLSFATAESARAMADKCLELAKGFEDAA